MRRADAEAGEVSSLGDGGKQHQRGMTVGIGVAQQIGGCS
jgi:hypothetical protein